MKQITKMFTAVINGNSHHSITDAATAVVNSSKRLHDELKNLNEMLKNQDRRKEIVAVAVDKRGKGT